MSVRHEPVLVAEVLRHLLHGPGLYLDATLGDGGHAVALLDAEPGARLLGCDRDAAAVAAARERLMVYGGRASVAQAKADLETARLNLGYTEIRSPIAGGAGGSAVRLYDSGA